jgi:putative endopeptidase
MRRLISLAALIALCSAAPRAAHSPATAGAPDVLAAHLNTSVSPATDFFEYSNGAWLAQNPIPASENSWTIGHVVQNETYARVLKITQEAALAKAARGTEAQKIGDFWLTATDSLLADRTGLAPLRDELARIDAAKDLAGILDAAFTQHPLGTGAFFGFGISQDDKASDVVAVSLAQGGLGLPNRDSYFNTDENSTRVRTAYPAHVQKLLELSDATAAARPGAGEAVLRFETELARHSRTLAERRDPEKNYNKFNTGDVTAKLTPSIDWSARLEAAGLHQVGYVIVRQPEFFSALDSLLHATPLEVLKDYLRYHLVAAYAPYLGGGFEAEDFHFDGTVLSGQQEQRPRWKRALDAEEDALGMVLGRLYVKSYFPPHTKLRYEKLVEEIRTAYRERIERLEWMSAETKQKALAKLALVGKKVGYPDRWKDYSALEIDRDSWAANMMRASRWQFDDNVKKFGKPVDRAEWHMTPQTYNAYYNPSNNEIVLPAAIFAIPGVDDDQADDAMIYGYAAASTIGHEITHGFDDQGRQFDPQGNLKSWWTKDDEEKFKARAQVMVDQFNAYEPLPGVHINGRAALGENIADLGGVLLGLDAFKKTEQFKRGETIGGLTPLQRYFLGYSLGWMGAIRKENLARRLLSDVHAPAKWRVLGPVSNVPEFYAAFGVKPGDPMWRPDSARVKIW